MLDSSRQHQLQLMQQDRGNALLHLCISVLSMAYLARRGSAEQQHERSVILSLMLVEAAALLVHAYSSYKGSAAAGFYARHRTMCTLVLQSVEFAANLAYIPRAFALNVTGQLAGGKHHLVMWNSLVSGCASFNVALHCLSMRLPLHIAAPFAAATAAAAFSMLPQHINYLCMPQISSIATGFKSDVDMVYNTAIGLLAGASSYEAGLPVTAPCPQLALMLWFSLCLVCVLPLYYLAVMEMNSRQLEVSSSGRLAPAAAAAGVQTSLGSRPLQELHSSSSSRRPCAAQEQQQQQQPCCDCIRGSSSTHTSSGRHSCRPYVCGCFAAAATAGTWRGSSTGQLMVLCLSCCDSVSKQLFCVGCCGCGGGCVCARVRQSQRCGYLSALLSWLEIKRRSRGSI